VPHLTLTNAFRSWEHLPPKGRHGMVRSEHKGNMPVRLGYAIIYVPDVTAAVEFYERAFGLARRFVHDSGEYAEMETGATALGFANEGFIAAQNHPFRTNRPGEAPAGVEIALIVEDVPSAFERALTAGAERWAEPAVKPWGQTVAFVRDLNGFLVELCTAIAASASGEAILTGIAQDAGDRT